MTTTEPTVEDIGVDRAKRALRLGNPPAALRHLIHAVNKPRRAEQ